MAGLTSGSKKSAVGLQHGAKSLLRNMIRHTDTHNRMLEEAEMWQLHHKMTGNKGGSSPPKDTEGWTSKDRGGSYNKRSHSDQSFLFDDRRVFDVDRRSRGRYMKRAHMDDECTTGAAGRETDQGSSTFWQRQLIKAEEADTERWGHGGFKELYPQEFDSDNPDFNVGENKGDNGEAKKVKKIESKKKKRDRKLKKKKKKSDREKHEAPLKKKKRKNISDSECSTSSEDPDSDLGYKRGHKRRKRTKLGKEKKIRSEIFSNSDSNSESSTKRSRKHSKHRNKYS